MPAPAIAPAELPEAPLAALPLVEPGISPKMPSSLAFSRVYDPLAFSVGNCAALAMPNWARDSANRVAATLTSRFSEATRRSSSVSSGSLNSVHQSTSIGSATGMLGGGFTASFGPANHDPGEAQPGLLKSGPTVQPPSAVAPSRAASNTSLALSVIRSSSSQ